MKIKVALVHDYLNQWGGAERVLAVIAELYPNAPIYTAIYDERSFSGQHASSKFKIITPQASHLPLISRFYKYFSFLYPLVFEGFDLSDYDVIISSSSNFAKGVITRPGQVHICYCHTPPRFLYHLPTEGNYRQHWLWGRLLSPLDNYLRVWDYCAAQRVDYFVANSVEVAGRIRKFYGREAQVIYPPVGDFANALLTRSRTYGVSTISQDGSAPYFLSVSRLSKYKNVDLIIRACNDLKLPLVVVGEGKERVRLQRLAGPTVQLVGRVSDETLADYYRNCLALICAASDEDFGITPVEAMSFGKPVIALRSGGYLETVIEGTTGEFFDLEASDQGSSGNENFAAASTEPPGTLSRKTPSAWSADTQNNSHAAARARRAVKPTNSQPPHNSASAQRFRGKVPSGSSADAALQGSDPTKDLVASASQRRTLKQVLSSFDPARYNPNTCWQQAQKFSKERFQREFRRFVEGVLPSPPPFSPQ